MSEKDINTSGLYNAVPQANENHFCGFAALRAITGVSIAHIESWVRAYRRNEHPERKHRPNERLDTMHVGELEKFLDYAGFETTTEIQQHRNPGANAIHYNYERDTTHYESINTRPTVARFIRELEPSNKKYILRIGGARNGHFIAIHKPSKSTWVVDTLERHPRPIPAGWKYNRSRVSHAIIITD